MPMLTYQRWKAEKVESGECRQTIRARRARPVKVGDTLYHYANARTPAMHRLRAGETDTCVETFPVTIVRRPTVLGTVYTLCDGEGPDAPHMYSRDADEIARRDGFADADAMCLWFSRHHALGERTVLDVIRW